MIRKARTVILGGPTTGKSTQVEKLGKQALDIDQVQRVALERTKYLYRINVTDSSAVRIFDTVSTQLSRNEVLYFITWRLVLRELITDAVDYIYLWHPKQVDEVLEVTDISVTKIFIRNPNVSMVYWEERFANWDKVPNRAEWIKNQTGLLYRYYEFAESRSLIVNILALDEYLPDVAKLRSNQVDRTKSDATKSTKVVTIFGKDCDENVDHLFEVMASNGEKDVTYIVGCKTFDDVISDAGFTSVLYEADDLSMRNKGARLDSMLKFANEVWALPVRGRMTNIEISMAEEYLIPVLDM